MRQAQERGFLRGQMSSGTDIQKPERRRGQNRCAACRDDQWTLGSMGGCEMVRAVDKSLTELRSGYRMIRFTSSSLEDGFFLLSISSIRRRAVSPLQSIARPKDVMVSHLRSVRPETETRIYPFTYDPSSTRRAVSEAENGHPYPQSE